MVIVRLHTQNRMVTKDYPAGVYEWVDTNPKGSLPEVERRGELRLGGSHQHKNENHENERSGKLTQNFPGYVAHADPYSADRRRGAAADEMSARS